MPPRTFLPALLGRRALEAKSYPYMRDVSAGRSYTGMRLRGSDRAASWDMDTVIAEGYERSVWTYRCVELISGSSARLPFRLARDYETDDAEVLDDHPLYYVLNRRANPHETARAFRKRLSAQALLSKRGAFIELTRSKAGTITRLDLLDPGRTLPVPSDKGTYVEYFQHIHPNGDTEDIDPERIRWVREPHPTDPFSGTTPLEAAGLSIELDHLSRLYNVTFIKNDARPGGVLAIDTDRILPEEMDRIERRFKSGAYTAGELAIIATGEHGMSYLDTTTRPRDMAYSVAAKNAKDEILSAFGVGESVLGNAAGRTFDNAEQEEYNFWTKPMPPHLDLLASAFADDLDLDVTPYFDTSKVDALEAGARRRRQEFREEFDKGLRSIDEYRPHAGLPTVNNAQSRALWVSPAKAPVPGTPSDAAELLGGEGGAPGTGAPPAGAVPPGAEPGAVEGYVASDQATSPQDVLDEALSLGTETADAPADAATGGAAAALAEARAGANTVPEAGEAANALASARAMEYKPGEGLVLPDAENASSGPADALIDARVRNRMEGKALSRATDYEATPQLTDDAIAELKAALTLLLDRQAGVIEQRVAAPKIRKGTKFWQPEYVEDTRGGEDPLPVERVVDPERWAQEAVTAASPIIQSIAILAGLKALSALGSTSLEVAVAPASIAGRATVRASLMVMTALEVAVRSLLDDLTEHLRVVALTAQTPDELRGAVREFYGTRGPRWIKGAGGDLAHAIVCAATEAAAAYVADELAGTRVIERTWVTRLDDRVRPTHRAVHGTTLPVGKPFQVGADEMLYPQDPAASPAERMGCRCRARYSSTRI